VLQTFSYEFPIDKILLCLANKIAMLTCSQFARDIIELFSEDILL